MKKTSLVIALFSFLQFGISAKQIKVHHETLENGLKVVIIQTKSNGAVRFGVIYNVGCADDQNCKVGLSHFLEHMMFKGTKTMSGEQLKQTIEKYNAYTNACTDDDYTLYYHSLNKQFLEVDMKIEEDRMVNLALTEEDFKREKNVIMEERHLRCDANPETRNFYDAVPRLLYLQSSYAYNGIGYPHHIKAYTQYALQKHYNKFYAPNNATLLIIGDVDKDSVMALAKNIFGKIKKTHDIDRKRVVDPEDLNITYTMDRTSDKITRKELSLVYKIPRKNIDTIKKRYVGKIAVDCLCGTQRSLMAKKFVEEENLLYQIDGNVVIKRFDKSYLFIDAITSNSSMLKESEQKVISYIKNISDSKNISNILTKEVFEINKKRILNQILMMNDNPGEMFNYVVDNIVNGYEINHIGNIYNIVANITWENVKDWIIENLREDNKTLTIYNHPKGSL